MRSTSLQSAKGNNTDPLITTEMGLQIPVCFIDPPIDRIQDKFAGVILNVVETFYAVPTWGQEAKTVKRRTRKPLIDEIRYEHNYFKYITEHQDVQRATNALSGGYLILDPYVKRLLCSTYDAHADLWADNKNELIETFAKTNPLTVEIRAKFLMYDERTALLLDSPKSTKIGSLIIGMERAFSAFVEQSKTWKLLLGSRLCSTYKKKLDDMVAFIKDQETILVRPLHDLDDVRLAMTCLDTVRENSIKMEMDLMVMVDAYLLFIDFGIFVSKEDQQEVDSLRYNFDKMIQHSKEVAAKIAEMEQPLLLELTTGIADFKNHIDEFNEDFEQRGPMVPGISAKEASDRAFMFQNRFEDHWRCFEMYSTGEKLFGLPVTDYPVLHQRKKEFNLLSKLYSLYLVVLKTIDGYCEIPWQDVVMEDIVAEVTDYQNSCRRLPKGMQTWNAYIELKTKIDDFNDTCPFLELMTSKGMKERHWTRLDTLMDYSFQVDDPNTTLGRIMAAPILKFREDVQDICTGAEKELDIEAKLKQVMSDWTTVNIQLGPFKTRGDLLLKGTYYFTIS